MSTEVIIIGVLAFIQGLFVLYVETRLKKSIEHQFDVKLKEIDQKFIREMATVERKDKYQLAALDKRLEVHQKAYAFSLSMKQTLERKETERMALGRECLDF